MDGSAGRVFRKAYGRAMQKLAWVDGWSAEQDREVYEKAKRDPLLSEIVQSKLDRMRDTRRAALAIGIPSSLAVTGLGVGYRSIPLGALGAAGLAANLYGAHKLGKDIDRYRDDEEYRRDINLLDRLARNPREEGLQTYLEEHGY